jgi:hypothetical protein
LNFARAAAASGLLACAVVSTASAQPAQTRRFSIPAHGSLVVDVPKGWRVAARPIEDPASAALRIGPSSGSGFVVQISALWLDPQKLAAYAPGVLKARVQKAAEDVLPRSVEPAATLVEFRGKGGYGYHYSLTDRSATSAPDDYKYLTQGMVLSGEVLTIFTYLHREPAPGEKQQVLQMLADLRHSKEADPPRADALQVRELEQSYELSVPVSRLVMTIPKSGMPRATRAPSPNNHPRYFYFVDGLLNVSGWFEPANGFRGIRPFWAEETENWRKLGLPAPVDTAFARIGSWDVVIYDHASAAGTNSHLRAHWVQAGTWIDIHLSLTAEAPSAQTRERLAQLLKAIEVREKN